MALGDFDGLHTQIKGIISVHISKSLLGRLLNRIFSALVEPPSSLRGVISILTVIHLVILSSLFTIETNNWITNFTNPKVCKESMVDKKEKLTHTLNIHLFLERRGNVRRGK